MNKRKCCMYGATKVTALLQLNWPPTGRPQYVRYDKAAETPASSCKSNFSIRVMLPHPITEIHTASSSSAPSRKCCCARICHKNRLDCLIHPDLWMALVLPSPPPHPIACMMVQVKLFISRIPPTHARSLKLWILRILRHQDNGRPSQTS